MLKKLNSATTLLCNVQPTVDHLCPEKWLSELLRCAQRPAPSAQAGLAGPVLGSLVFSPLRSTAGRSVTSVSSRHWPFWGVRATCFKNVPQSGFVWPLPYAQASKGNISGRNGTRGMRCPPRRCARKHAPGFHFIGGGAFYHLAHLAPAIFLHYKRMLLSF